LHSLPALHSFPTRRSSDLEAGSTKTELLRQAQSVGLASFQQAQEYAGEIGIGNILAVGRDGRGIDGILRGILGQLAFRQLRPRRSEEHTSELQSPYDLVCR